MSRIVRPAGPCRGGLYVVEGEVCLLVTAMRRGARWSSHSHQDDDQDALMKGLGTLKEVLNEHRDLSQLEPAVFLTPFLEIIRSEETTGPVTSLALSAVNKIISYGLVDSNHPAVAICVEAIADAVTHARFVGADASGDGVVLMRVLQVLRALMLSPAGDHLSNESVCEIMLSCFRICFETRLSEILRKTAEHCLRDMVQHLFTRLPQFVEDTRVLPNMKKMRTNSIENTRSKSRKQKSYTKQKSKSTTEDVDEKESSISSAVDKIRANHLATTPVSPVGNIVDMQGTLNHASVDKNEDEKSESKINVSKEDTKDGNDCIKATDNQEADKKQEIDKDGSNGDIKSEIKTIEANSTPENIDVENKVAASVESKSVENKVAASAESKSVEKEDTADQKIADESESSIKQSISPSLSKLSISENQGDEEKSIDLAQSPTGSVEDLSIDENVARATKVKESEQIEEYVNSQGVRFISLQQRAPYGALCVRELFRFLISLCSPFDKQNNEIMTHLGLSLLQVALEIAADALSNFLSLLALAKDDLCRNLILLLGTDRLSILAVNLQVSYLLFESQREHLKFQLEHYLIKLMDIVVSESNRISYEQRELALEAIVRLWRIPGLPAELYLNYDCGLYSTNLYEELMKMFSKNVSLPMTNGMHTMQLISLDAIMMLIVGMEIRCKGCKELCKPSRHEASSNLPTREDLLDIKSNKRWLVLGTEKFNENPRAGIAKLTEQGLLSDTSGHSDPEKIAKLLRENPGLDKKAIGEYISKKENMNILNCFVHNFDLRNTRIDQALRLYLESFRLPGEAPLIFLLLEKFAEHWHDSNGRPFASADAAFALAYAVIMLNVDQHNYNVRRQSNPMTADEFKKNLKKVNGDVDFDQDMLDEIYTSIKGEEIVMPAEQTGLVKENYLWKVLLRRGCGPESAYLKVGNSGEFIDKDLAEHAWGPIISALCRAYDKAPDRTLQRKVAQTFLSCAAISAYHGMCGDLDTLIVSLCKFTGLQIGGKSEQVVLHLGGSPKSQMAARTLFKITHLHGDALRASWKNIIDCLQSLYEARLLPKNLTEAEDFIDSSGKISLLREPTTPKTSPGDQGILSTFYSYIAMDTSRLPHPAEATARKKAMEFIANCYLKEIIEESKFFQSESLNSLVGALVSVNPNDEDISIFLLELLLEVTIQNRDRVTCIWPVVQSHLDRLLTVAARENHPYLLERVAVGMLRLAIRLLRGEEFACLSPLLPLTHLPSATTVPLARQIAYGLFELLKTGAANIHSAEDWKVVFSLLECAGAGALAPKRSNTVLDETTNARASVLDPRPISPVPEWVLVSPTGTEAPLPVAADTIVLARDLQPHDSAAFVKCCDSLNFLVRDMAHVTPFNFDLCVNCVRTFAEAVLQCAGKRNRVCNSAEESADYQRSPVQLLELIYTLHTRIAQVFRWWAEEGSIDDGISLWPQAWRPLLQSIARLCCDARRLVRTSAIAYLQSTLMAQDLAQLSAIEWSQCLEEVLFPLLAQLLGPIASNDPIGVEETRVRVAMLLSKVFLQRLTPLLSLPGFLPLWLTVLELLRAYMHADNSELLFEAIPESLKNMLLVMSSANVLAPSSNLWAPTWRAIDTFLPNLKAELFPEPPIAVLPPQPSPQQSSQSQVISLVGQAQQPPSFPGSIAPQPESTFSSADIECSSENNIDTKIMTQPLDILNSAQSGGIPVPLPTLMYNTEGKETQQVITLVSQPAPSVSSPVAVQPTAQSFFDICYSANSLTEKTDERQQLLQEQQQQQQSMSPSEEEHSKLMKNTAQNVGLADENRDLILAMRKYEEWKQQQEQQQMLMQQQCTQHTQSAQYQHSVTENSPYRVDPSEKMTVDSTGTTTTFNSASYFSEDPAADLLFVVTNP
ncbi:Golgi-specific brefeldin A-resistance guanine nucleotide exchange factor 1 isoform X2 [Temnothorax curvispinosus]|uniref:Golgi-specific brefeldin A-resistance guanine nucleotide exchange factor 1 isoform X2 n=1 Tax=Temnothorax curvispinosus TaxID=300111 RepID=A0A6J1QUX9_9HYME|nr:Golgi-specific brefeldin A-resistance guanine nucleotide exchange factor 1 isoform X2 [Temnothorax curvispinosus]